MIELHLGTLTEPSVSMPAFEADHGASEAEEGVVDVVALLISDSQSSPSEEPSERSFDDASINAEAAAVRLAALGDRRHDAASPQRLADRLGVVRAVGKEEFRSSARSAAWPLNRRDRFDERKAEA